MDRKQVLTTRDFALSVSNYGATREHQYDLAVLPWGATSHIIIICLILQTVFSLMT